MSKIIKRDWCKRSIDACLRTNWWKTNKKPPENQFETAGIRKDSIEYIHQSLFRTQNIEKPTDLMQFLSEGRGPQIGQGSQVLNQIWTRGSRDNPQVLIKKDACRLKRCRQSRVWTERRSDRSRRVAAWSNLRELVILLCQNAKFDLQNELWILWTVVVVEGTAGQRSMRRVHSPAISARFVLFWKHWFHTNETKRKWCRWLLLNWKTFPSNPR